MAFQGHVTQVQGLNDPGVGAAASVVGQGLSSAASLLANKRKNANDLLTSLLGDTAGLYKQHMDNRNNLDALNLQYDINGNINDQVLAQMGLGGQQPSSQSQPMITEQPQSPATPQINQQDQPIAPDSRLQEQPLTFNGADQSAKQLIGKPGSPQQPLQGGLSAEDTPQPAQQMSMPQQTGGMDFSALRRLSPEKLAPVLTMLGQTPLGKQQIARTKLLDRQNYEGQVTQPDRIGKIKTDAGQSALNYQQSKNTTLTDDYKYGPGATSSKEINPQISAIDPAGNEFPFPMTPKQAGLRATFALKTPEKRSEIAEKVTSGANYADQMINLKDRLDAAKQSGLLNRVKYQVSNDGLGRILVPDNAPQDVVEVLGIMNQMNLNAFELAKSLQSANSISNQDIARLVKAMGDPSMSKAVFDNAFKNLLVKTNITNLQAAQLTNAPAYNQLIKLHGLISPNPYNPESDRPFNDAFVTKINSQPVKRQPNNAPVYKPDMPAKQNNAKADLYALIKAQDEAGGN